MRRLSPTFRPSRSSSIAIDDDAVAGNRIGKGGAAFDSRFTRQADRRHRRPSIPPGPDRSRRAAAPSCACVAVSLTRPSSRRTSLLRRRRAHVRPRECDVAAENGFALACEAGAQCIRERADAGDHHDAQRQARDKDAEALEAAAQARACRASGSSSATHAAFGEQRMALSASVTTAPHALASLLSSSATIEPSDMRMTRSVLAASRSSCVTITSVALRRWRKPNSSSMI